MSEPTPRPARDAWLAALVCLAFALWSAPSVSMERAWGWDESMHAELPAARMALELQGGHVSRAARVALECQRYPFAWPAALAGVQLATGPSEKACRVAGRVVWAVGLLGLFALARAAVEALERERGRPLRNGRAAPWIALFLGATCPLAFSYSGTLFLEVPFTVASIWTLRAWLRRRAPGAGAWQDLCAGAWLTVAFFAKFNYGLLLVGALGLDALVEGALAARAGQGGAFLRRAAAAAALPLLAALWWFVLPFPAAREFGASHRAAFVEFLAGNRDPSMHTDWTVRAMHWGAYFVRSPRWLVLLAIGLAATLARAGRPSVRTLWIALCASGVPIALHPFHLDRFLVVLGPPLWTLAALGLAPLLPAARRPRAALAAAVAVLLFVAPAWDGGLLLEALGVARPETRAYQDEVLAGWRSLAPDRLLETNGLARGESEALLDLLATELRPEDHVAWVGLTNSFSPGALFLGLSRRDPGFHRALLVDRLESAFVTLDMTDPGWDDARLLRWADAFDVWIGTRPVEMRNRPGREFLGDYQRRLIESGRWTPREVGTFELTRPGQAPHTVWVYAARPTR